MDKKYTQVSSNILNNNIGYPLKCIVTSNTNTLKYLKTSGSLIVLDQTDIDGTLKDTEYREIYLGDNFLAGGYGVYTKEQQNDLIEIITTFKGIIDELHEIDTDLANDILSKYEELLNNKLDKEAYIDSSDPSNNKGNASETYIEFSNSDNTVYYIKTKDILQLIANLPVYEDIEIENVSYDIIVVDCVGREQLFTNATHLPINTYIRQITIKVDISR